MKLDGGFWIWFAAVFLVVPIKGETEMQGNCMCPGKCPPGYMERTGDVKGKGSIPHQKEWGLDQIEECAEECDKRMQCHSFLFGKTGFFSLLGWGQHQCKLMKDILPTDPPYRKTTFCVKCSSTSSYAFLLQGNLTITFSSVHQLGYKVRYKLYREGQGRELLEKDYEEVHEGSKHVIGSITNPQDKILMMQIKKGFLRKRQTRRFNLDGIVQKRIVELYESDHHIASLIIELEAVTIDDIQLNNTGLNNPRGGNKVTLYQDADTIRNIYDRTEILPIFRGGPNGTVYKTYDCFRDIHDAIKRAKKFIYVTGWMFMAGTPESDYGDLELIKIPDRGWGGNSGFGYNLRKKSTEGVDVRILAWDNRQMNLKIGDTVVFDPLGGSLVPSLINYTNEDNTNILVAPVVNLECDDCTFGILSGKIFAHHQKSMVMDQDGESAVAFVGGFDMMNARYDTPEHSLKNKGYFRMDPWAYKKCGENEMDCKDHNPEHPIPDYITLPWHDTHSQVEGLGALDIYENFIRRWNTQVNDDIIKNAPKLHNITDLRNAMMQAEKKPGNFTIEIVRSISKLSDNSIELDTSIYQTYMKMVRQANDYIYIESQFFSGSSNMWLTEKDEGHTNKLSFEIVRKIISKIEKKEQFLAFIIIPLHPNDGKPPSHFATQDLLFRQRRTMEFMYHEVALAVRYVYGRYSKVKPTDYLKFFCLGKTLTKGEKRLLKEKGARPDERWRNQIYVHAKLTITDDKFVLISSSHVDDRSTMGNRDTEIGMLAYQQTKNGTVVVTKEIQEYRMALLSEHLGGYDKDCVDLASNTCLQKLTRVSKTSRDLYMTDPEEDTEDDNKERMIHLIPFPINVTKEGKVGPEKDWVFIPDSNASVEGETDWTMRLANRFTHVHQRGKQEESNTFNRQASLKEVHSVCVSELPEPGDGDEPSYEYDKYPKESRRLSKEDEEIAGVEQTNESTTTTTFTIPILNILIISVNVCLLLHV